MASIVTSANGIVGGVGNTKIFVGRTGINSLGISNGLFLETGLGFLLLEDNSFILQE